MKNYLRGEGEESEKYTTAKFDNGCLEQGMFVIWFYVSLLMQMRPTVLIFQFLKELRLIPRFNVLIISAAIIHQLCRIDEDMPN